MEILVTIFLTAVIVTVIKGVQKNENTSSQSTHLDYKYRAKEHLMTRTEEEFFDLLTETVFEKYYVFPQIHLSALLDHKIKGQNWKGAFAHINGKSVDHVLCDKHTLKPVYAIELDDYTHKKEDRMKRDERVEEIFANTEISLVRFTSIRTIGSDDIIAKLSRAHKVF